MSPTFSMYLNIAAAVLSALTGGAAMFTDLFGQGPAQKIMAGVSLAGVIISAVNGALHATSTSAPGPLEK